MSTTPWLRNGSSDRDAQPSLAPVRYGDELELARSVVAGSRESWRMFLKRYSGLIHAVIRRHLHSRDRDEIGAVFVDVLESLYRGKLATYEGRAALSTWLTLVVRSQVFDHLRRCFGRREIPEALRRLDPAAREVLRLYFIEGRGVSEVLRHLNAEGDAWTLVRLLQTLRRIDERVDRRWLQRLAYDLHARSIGAASGRLLEYLDHLRIEMQQQAGAHSPEYELMQREAGRTTACALALVDRLPEEERRLLAMRFERRWSARRIADELGLGSPRGVYTALDRILRRLRRDLSRKDMADA